MPFDIKIHKRKQDKIDKIKDNSERPHSYASDNDCIMSANFVGEAQWRMWISTFMDP